MNDEESRRIVVQRYAFRSAMLDAASYAVRNAAATALDDSIKARLDKIERELDELCEMNARVADWWVEDEE